jgi:hypothetical protein
VYGRKHVCVPACEQFCDEGPKRWFLFQVMEGDGSSLLGPGQVVSRDRSRSPIRDDHEETVVQESVRSPSVAASQQSGGVA